MDSLGTGFDALLTRGALVVLLLAVTWAAVVVLAVAVEARSSGRVRIAQHTGCPPVVRLWLLGLFTALFAGIAPAQAGDLGSHPGHGPSTTVDAALDGLPLPDRPADRLAGRPGAAPGPGSEVVVTPGDSLWRIAERRLGRAADAATVAAAVRATYAANRPAIGPDPDRISPGQHLVFPTPPTPPEEP